MKYSICVPMYNEGEIIQHTAQELDRYLSENIADYELIFVSDGSTDDCAQKVEALQLPRVQVQQYHPNRGKGCAVRTGVMAAQGDIVLFIDADLAYGTQVIGEIAELFETHPDVDVIIGSRPMHPQGYAGYTPLRKLASKVYIKVLCLAGGFRLTDSQCGCKAFRGPAAKAIFSRCQVDRFAFDFEAIMIAQKLQYRILEFPVQIINHRDSKVRIVRDTFQMLGELGRIKKRMKRFE